VPRCALLCGGRKKNDGSSLRQKRPAGAWATGQGLVPLFAPYTLFQGGKGCQPEKQAGSFPAAKSAVLVLTARHLRTALISDAPGDFDLAGDVTPLPFVKGAKLVIHLLPVEAFAARIQFDALRLKQNVTALRPMSAMSWDTRINLHGVIGFALTGEKQLVRSYIQIYRNAIIEVVEGTLLGTQYEGARIIPSIAYERDLLQYLGHCFELLRIMGSVPPVIVALTLLGVRGLQMASNRFGYNELSEPIAEDNLVLPEAWVEDVSMQPAKILKPMFDLVWNACGLPGSLNFDAQGNWKMS